MGSSDFRLLVSIYLASNLTLEIGLIYSPRFKKSYNVLLNALNPRCDIVNKMKRTVDPDPLSSPSPDTMENDSLWSGLIGGRAGSGTLEIGRGDGASQKNQQHKEMGVVPAC